MHLNALSLRHFRNIEEWVIEFHPRFNVFVGPNAQGKTNLLEAVYLLAFGRSFRILDHKGLMKWEKVSAQVRGFLTNKLGKEEREIRLSLEGKKGFKNGKPASPNQFRSMPTVLFAPEEILLLKDSPQARRDYVDGIFSKLSATYGDHLKHYKRALNQRNKLLKDEDLSPEEKKRQMVLWEKPLQEHGTALIQERQEWTQQLNHLLKMGYQIMAGAAKQAEFAYQRNIDPTQFAEKQAQMRDEEIARGTSLVGPHKDDFIASLDSQPIRFFGSQGEMRTFTLALKLCEIKLFEEVLEESPILLLDDVLSELDEARSLSLFSFLKTFKGQVFATATSLNLFPKEILNDFSCWEVQAGCFAQR